MQHFAKESLCAEAVRLLYRCIAELAWGHAMSGLQAIAGVFNFVVDSVAHHVVGSAVLATVGTAAATLPLVRDLVRNIPTPDPIRRLMARGRRTVRFGHVADVVPVCHDDCCRDAVLQHLLRAFWRGDFESSRGRSRVTLLGPDGRPICLSRRDLLLQRIGIEAIYCPSRQELADQSLPWKALKNIIHFDRIAAIPIVQYTPDFRYKVLEHLRIPRRDFRRWYHRFREYQYEIDDDPEDALAPDPPNKPVSQKSGEVTKIAIDNGLPQLAVLDQAPGH